MLYSDGIDINKTSESKECDICQYWYFLNNGFKFQPDVCNRCHDVLVMSINLSDIAVLNINGVDYRCIIKGTSKSEAADLLEKVDLKKKWNIKKNIFPHANRVINFKAW